MEGKISSSMGFTVSHNVSISVIDTRNNVVRKSITTHNKASRQMVTGLLRFLDGHFTKTSLQPEPQYTETEKYIPCFLGCGDGGVVLAEKTSGSGQYVPQSSSTDIRVPQLEEDWNETANYAATGFVREFFTGKEEGEGLSGHRSRIRKTTNTLEEVATADMDSLYFYCEVRPGELNSYYWDNPIFITELGLFADSIPGTQDMLAYIRLGNYVEDDVEKTNALFVRPDDTVVIRWIITIAAIGKDSKLVANIKDDNGNIITTTIQQIPTLGEFPGEDIPLEPQPSPFTYVYIRDAETREIIEQWDNMSISYGLAKNYLKRNPEAGNRIDPNRKYEFVIVKSNADDVESDNNGLSNIPWLQKFICYSCNVHTISTTYFSGSENLTEVEFYGPIRQIRNAAFMGTAVKELYLWIDYNYTYSPIESAAFYGATDLVKLTIKAPQDSVPGFPWGAPNPDFHVEWVG